MQAHANPVRLGSVINDTLLEPRMLQCLLCRDALLRVVNEYLAKKVEELAVEWGVHWNELLQEQCQSNKHA